MPSRDSWLLNHASDVHSQSGEDGILRTILERLEPRTGWCVEFGAWDGLHYSNTANLIRTQGYSAVMIEASVERYRDLVSTYRDLPRVHPVRAFVGYGLDDNLDAILRKTPVPTDFDLLSIDIDGNDYHVWSAITEYSPRCVVIEYNPTIPTGIHFIQERNPAVMHGSSVDALAALGERKGYALVAVTRFNAIFVRREFFPAFEIADNSVRTLRTDESLVTHVFCGYDGTVFVRGYGKLPWHDLPYTERFMQPLPRFLRQWRENYGPIRAKLFGLYRRARKAGSRRH